MKTESLPYETSTVGTSALQELQRSLSKFGCQGFGYYEDYEKGITCVQFQWRNQKVSLEASWKGYAAAYLKMHPHTYRMTFTEEAHTKRAMTIAQSAVCSCLRDWVKGQITAVECGVMSFATAFMPHMLLPNGERVIDKVKTLKVLAIEE